MIQWKKLGRTVLCTALGVCMAVCGVAAQAAETVQSATENTLQFSADGKLKIAVFSDVQTTQNVSDSLLDNLSAVLDAEQPDLVVYLGDQVEGKHPYVHIGDNEEHVKTIIEKVLSPVVERGIPFAVVFGNHDAQDSGVDKETQMAYYQSFPGCLAVDEGDALPGCGTYNILCTSSDGSRTALNLYFVDSLEYDEQGGYGCVSKEQIAWCRAVGETLAQANGGETVPALVFQHIIVPEVYNTFTQVRSGTDDAFAGKGVGKGSWFVVPDSIIGVLGEAPCPPEYSNGQFAAWRDVGDVQAAFFGHDHLNSFITQLEGIDLVACPGATYTSYNSDDARGVRIIELDENTIADGAYETRVILFRDIEATGPLAAVKRFFGNSFLWEYIVPCVVMAVVALAAIVATVILTVRRRKKKKAAAQETAEAK